MSSDQIALISQRLDALTNSRSHSLSTVKSNLSHDVDSISTEVHTQFSHQLTRNREQVMTALTDLSSSIQRNLSNDILSMFAAFTESLQDADLEALDISNWVSSTLNLFENHFGALSIDRNTVLDVVNEFNATWNTKVEGLTASNKYLNLPPQSSKQEDNVSRGRESSRDSRDINDIPSSSAGRDASKSRVSEGRSPSASERKGLFSKIGGLFKAERAQSNATEGPKVVNLGKEKNFRWDPDKKRYIFDDESEGEEEQEDTGPPLMKFASESAIKKTTDEPHSLVKPPEHRALKSKKGGPAPQKEAKRPAFIPSAPSLGAEEQKQASTSARKDVMYEGLDVVESIRRRIDEIFYQASHEEVVIKGINKLKRDLKALDGMSGPSLNDEIAREAKFLVMESELESTQISIVRESYSRKLLETELSSLRESFQQSMEKEFELSESVRELERDLNMYKDVYSIKSQVQNTVNASQMQQKVLEQFLQSLKETNAEKRKLIDANNQLRDTELQLQEAKAALKVMQAKYEQVMDYQRTGSGSAGQLKSLLEDSYKAQKEQDRLIIQLKEENLGLVARCKELFGQIGGLQGDNNGLRGHIAQVEGRLGEVESSLSQAQNQIGELENSLGQAQGQIGELENSSSQAQEEISKYEIQIKLSSQRIQELDNVIRDVEGRLQEEEDARRQVEEKLQEEENVRAQLEARLQSEEGYRRELEERLQEEEAGRRRAQEEVEEYARRLEAANEEKEVIVRRFEESTEEGRRLKIQLEELDKEVKTAWEQRDQTESQVRREREQMLEELLEHKNMNQLGAQEKELMNKFVEEITQSNLSLEERVQGLNNEVNRLNTEKQKSIEAILQFITEMKNVISDTSDLQTLEEYVTGLLGGRVDISQHYFRAVGVLPKIRDAIIRELDAEKTRKNLEIENLTTQLGNIEKERILSEDQQRAVMEECQRLGGLVEANNEQTQQYEAKLQELVGETERLRAEIEGYNQQNIHLQRALQQKELELGENLRAFEEHQQQQNSTLHNFEAQIRQLNDLKEEMWKIQAGQEEEKARGAQAHLIKAELEEQVNRLKEENVDLQQQIDEGFEQYTFLQSKAKELMGQLKQAKDENAQLRNEHQELEQTNRKMSSQLEIQVTSETSIIQQQAVTIESLEAEKAGMAQEIAALRERVDILSQELVNKEGASSGEVQTLHDTIQGLTQELQAREAALNEKDARINELVANNTLLTALQEGQQSSEAVMARVEELNKVIADKDAGIRELETFRENALADIKTLVEEKDNVLAGLQAVQTERDEVMAALKTLQEAKNEAAAGDIAALNERVQVLGQELEASNARGETATREVDALSGRVNTLTIELTEKDARINELVSNNTLLNALQEGQQSSEAAVQQLMARIEELNKVIAEKDAGIRELEAFREDALVNIKTLTEEKEHVLASLQSAQTERDEAVATVKAMQESEKENITRLDLLQLERDDLLARLQEEETRTYSLNHVLEETHTNKQSIEGVQKEMEFRLHSLEEEKARLTEERNGAVQERDDLRREVRELNNLLAQRSEEKGVSSIGIDGEELWAEIEREYGGSRIMEYLQSMKAKIGVDSREFTGVKLIGVLLKEFEEAIGDISRGMEEKEATLIGLTRSLDDMNEQYQKLQNHMTMLEGEQSEKEDYSSIRELYEKKTKRVEELLKEISTKNGQMEQMKKSMDEQARMLDENQKRKGSKGSDELESSLKEEVATLRQEVEKEKEKATKIAEEFENYKKKQKDTSEERGAIQHSYAQIIKNLSLQLDELKKKKGIPTATVVSKSTQTGEEEPKKTTVVEEGGSGKKQGFLSGMAKFFLTEGEAKKI